MLCDVLMENKKSNCLVLVPLLDVSCVNVWDKQDGTVKNVMRHELCEVGYRIPAMGIVTIVLYDLFTVLNNLIVPTRYLRSYIFATKLNQFGWKLLLFLSLYKYPQKRTLRILYLYMIIRYGIQQQSADSGCNETTKLLIKVIYNARINGIGRSGRYRFMAATWTCLHGSKGTRI
jgi:hypothetical protein